MEIPIFFVSSVVLPRLKNPVYPTILLLIAKGRIVICHGSSIYNMIPQFKMNMYI